jgi:acetylornithine deacetylase/succinyl-diaminopimelate desuccinylase-like protein
VKRGKLNRKSLNTFVRENKRKYETLLKEFVEIPTVSMDPRSAREMKRGVQKTVETIREFGGTVRVIETRGYPVIHGAFHHSRHSPTVGVYNHLDVQPASQQSEPWKTDPFRLVKDGDRYFGRGTTDDKGPALTALFGIRAARALKIPVNIHLIWEFEEEIGSPNFAEALKKLPSDFSPKSVVVSDTIWISRTRPACSAGHRGHQGFSFILKTGEADTHSGDTGGVARNPIGELMDLVCKMYDPISGKVKIPGFYDDVIEPTPQELRDFERSGFSVRDFKRNYSLKKLRTEKPLEVMKRIWALPTFEVHGVVGGYTGAGIKSIVPPAAEVKISCRLVANQKPEKIARLVTAFAKKVCPDVKVYLETGTDPYTSQTTGPYAEALKRAVEFGFGRTPIFVREGGSIGAVSMMDKAFRCPILFLGLSLPEHGYHAPNENFDWRQASGGMAAFARYFQEASQL